MKTRETKRNSVSVNAAWFKSMLEQKKMSQRKLAKELGLDPAAVSLMLQGKRKLQLGEAERIAEILGVNLQDVLLAAGVQAISHQETVGLQEALRRLMKHSTAYAMECTARGDISNAQAAIGDVKVAMNLLETMLKKQKRAART